MKHLLLIKLFIAGIFLISCSMKPMYKNITDLKDGDTKLVAIEKWGEPDYVDSNIRNNIEREVWIYECRKYPECYDDSDCRFIGPCYFLYFENSRIIDIYDATRD